jgi:hypothetical protein
MQDGGAEGGCEKNACAHDYRRTRQRTRIALKVPSGAPVEAKVLEPIFGFDREAISRGTSYWRA